MSGLLRKTQKGDEENERKSDLFSGGLTTSIVVPFIVINNYYFYLQIYRSDSVECVFTSHSSFVVDRHNNLFFETIFQRRQVKWIKLKRR